MLSKDAPSASKDKGKKKGISGDDEPIKDNPTNPVNKGEARAHDSDSEDEKILWSGHRERKSQLPNDQPDSSETVLISTPSAISRRPSQLKLGGFSKQLPQGLLARPDSRVRDECCPSPRSHPTKQHPQPPSIPMTEYSGADNNGIDALKDNLRSQFKELAELRKSFITLSNKVAKQEEHIDKLDKSLSVTITHVGETDDWVDECFDGISETFGELNKNWGKIDEWRLHMDEQLTKIRKDLEQAYISTRPHSSTSVRLASAASLPRPPAQGKPSAQSAPTNLAFVKVLENLAKTVQEIGQLLEETRANKSLHELTSSHSNSARRRKSGPKTATSSTSAMPPRPTTEAKLSPKLAPKGAGTCSKTTRSARKPQYSEGAGPSKSRSSLCNANYPDYHWRSVFGMEPASYHRMPQQYHGDGVVHEQDIWNPEPDLKYETKFMEGFAYDPEFAMDNRVSWMNIKPMRTAPPPGSDFYAHVAYELYDRAKHLLTLILNLQFGLPVTHGAMRALAVERAKVQQLRDMIGVEIGCHTGFQTHDACSLSNQQDELVSIGDHIMGIADMVGIPLELYPEHFFPPIVDLRHV